MRRTILAAGLAAALCPPGAAQADIPPEVAALIEAQAAKIRDLEARLERLEGRAPAVAPAPAPALATRPESSPAPVPASAPAVTVARAGTGPTTPILRGRAQFDALVYNNKAGDRSTGTEVRRFYLGAKGEIGERLSYVAEADFGGGEVSLQDVMVSYAAAEGLELVAGHFKPPITADEMTSDVHTLFLERSAYAAAFAPGRRLGVAAHAWGERWGLRGGVFGEGEDAELDTVREEAWLAALRGHADLLDGAPALHLALSAYHTRIPDRAPGVWLRIRPETGRAARLLDTGAFIAREGTFVGGEIGYGAGPLTLQAEGGRVGYRGPSSNPDFHGWSIQGAWRWTGEARPYDIESGSFGRVSPDRPLGEGGWGALETGLRVTRLDLSDPMVEGGAMTTYGAVVNWTPVTRLRLSANLIQARIERLGAEDADETLLTLRTAIDW